MNIYLIYDPKTDSYIKISSDGWTSGHMSAAVNGYESLEKARNAVRLFHSLNQCTIIEVVRDIEIIQQWALLEQSN